MPRDFEAHRPRLRALAYRMLGSRSEAEDVVQDAWLRWQAADQAQVQDPLAQSLLTVFSWGTQGSKPPRSRRLPQPMLAAWARRATTSVAVCCLAQRVVPQKQRLRRCNSSPGHQPGCGLRLAATAFAGQRTP